MDQNDNLYPNIVSEEETKKLIDSKLNESRVKHMFNERDRLVKDLKHYKKILKRWKKIDSSFKITSVGIIATTSIAAGITGALVTPLLVPLFLPPMLGSLSALESVLFTGLLMGLSSRKKKKFDNKCKLIQSYLDKIFYYIDQCKQDSIITLEELKGFESLMNEYRNDIEHIDTLHDGQTKILSDSQMKKLKEEADKEVRKLFKEDLKKEIIQSQYHAATATVQKKSK